MAPTAYYPPSALPWQVVNPGPMTSAWRVELRTTMRGPLLATLHVEKDLQSGWRWWIIPYTRLAAPVIVPRRRMPYKTYLWAERAMLQALAEWLHGADQNPSG